MSFGQIWSVAVGTGLALAIILFLFYLKRMLRRRLFQEGSTPARDQALADLLLFQARLEQRASRLEEGGRRARGGEPDVRTADEGFRGQRMESDMNEVDLEGHTGGRDHDG